MTEYIITALKFLAIAVSGVAGVIAVIGKTKDDEGRLTHWGKLMLAGIVLSGVVASAIQVEELIKQRREAEESARRAKQTVQELQSPLMPSTNMAVSFAITMKLDHPRLKRYRERLLRLVSPALKAKTPPPAPPGSQWATTTDLGSGVTTVTGIRFGPTSALYPQASDDPNLPRVFDYFGIESHITEQPSGGGLWFFAFPKDGKREYWYEAEDNTIEFEVSEVLLRPGDNWHSDGTIVSLPQLVGKELKVDFLGIDWGNDQENVLGLELQKMSSLGFFKFFAANRAFFLSGGQNKIGQELVYIFPPDFLKSNGNLPQPSPESETNQR